MKKNKFLEKGSTIGVVAPSFGLFDLEHQNKYDNAKRFFINNGYNIKESSSLFTENFLGVSDALTRANDFMDMYLDDNIDLIYSVAGGETMLEVIDYIDFEKLKKAKGKYFLGYSDNTSLVFLLTTICEVESIYTINFTSYSDIYLDYVKDNYKLLTDNKLTFNSYPYFEDENGDLSYKVNYIGNCNMKGILLGGCLEILQNLCGTKYDNMKEFNKKYKEIIFFIEPYAMTPLEVRFSLWQLRNAGWFDNAIGFIFGRTQNNYEYLSYVDAVNRALSDLNKPIIINFDLGHIKPVIPFISGRYASIIVKDGKGVLSYE